MDLGRITVLRFFILTSAAAAAGCSFLEENGPSVVFPTPTPGAQDRYLPIRGVNYHVAEYAADGPDIVMIHGFASSSYTWNGVAPLLQKSGLHVFSVDMKGFGWSDRPRGADYDPRTLAREVTALMDALGIKKAAIAGNSLGGAVSLMIAGEQPERVDTLVLVDSAGYQQKKPIIMRLMELPGSEYMMNLFFSRRILLWNLREVFHNDDWLTDEKLSAYYDRLRAPGAMEAQADVVRALDFGRFKEFVDKIPEIRKRTLIIWGKEDVWVPFSNAERFRRELKNSILATIQDCGHIPQEEFPELTARIIIDFLSGKLASDADFKAI
jgi:pimeloyl-ACP methyl ester carboxylesterase